jgi:thioredoxin reductase
MAEYDVVVVGGGVAGLSAAMMLGRSRRRVVVVDAGEPRNAPAAHLHGFLSRDGMDPAELLSTARREVVGYGGSYWRDERSASTASTGRGSPCAWPTAGGWAHARWW